MRRALLLISFLSAASACVPTPPSVSLSCSSDSDCSAGYVCVLGEGDVARCEGNDAGVPLVADASVSDDAASSEDAGHSFVDAGHHLDGGALDGSAPIDIDTDTDAGAIGDAGDDAGLLVDGGEQSEQDWPAPGWSFRKRLTLTAPDDRVAAGAPIRVSLGDTDALMNDDRALSSGDDLRILHFDGRRWRECPRVLAQAGGGGGFRGGASSGPVVMIRAVRTIGLGSSDDGYWLYYGNEQAGAPPTAGVPAQRSLLVASPFDDSTVSESFTDVASMTVRPSAPDEVWVVIATWQQSYQSLDIDFDSLAGGVQLLVDGAPLTSGVLQSMRTTSSRWHTGVAMTVLRGALASDLGAEAVASHEIALRYRAVSFEEVLNPASLRNVRLLAFVLPTGSDRARVDQQLERQTLVGDLPTQQSASAWSASIPARPTAPHLWLGYNFVHEGPGVAAGALELLFDNEVVRFSEESWLDGPIFHSLFHAAVVSLDTPHSAELRYVASTGEGSEVAGITQAFLPLGGFSYAQASAASQSTGALIATELLALPIPATSLEHEYVYLGAVGSTYDAPGGNGSEVTTVTVQREASESVPLATNEYAIPRGQSYVVSVGAVGRELRSSPATLRVRAHTTSPSVPARVESPFLLWLRYPEVSTSFGAQEGAP